MRSACKHLHHTQAGEGVKAELWRRKAAQDSGPDPETSAWRQALLEKRHLEAYRNMHRLRDALYQRYAALLKDKVHSQRLQLQQRNETARAKSENDTKQKQKKSASCELQRNDSHLTSLPKTSYYLIYDIQQQLAKCGHLKTHHDLEDFYRCIKFNSCPSQLQKSLLEVRKKMLESKSASDLMTHFKMSENHLGKRHEDPASHSRLLGKASSAEETSAELISDGSQETDEPEQTFLKMKAPIFATLQPNFMRNFQSKMPDLKIPEIPEKSRKAEIYLRRLRKMYELSLSNMASAQRLLDRETDSLCWQEEGGVQDLVLPAIESKKERNQSSQLPPCSMIQPKSVQNHRSSCSPSRVTSASHQCFEALVRDTATSCRKTPDPLSIEDVFRQKGVEIIDCGIKLWRNYIENSDQ
ncbi:uncharacterized protein si:ch211-130h14.4 [Mugil cephalus]|uniref:uncharacterized protein si:ch211-130h14.4 n=1 Tax=Mugil cephalus TaxID=48193 RepID=UPI001FB641D7|nr:uncharacterized protein si:ch211-130h14.4 [Mugil cephalus]